MSCRTTMENLAREISHVNQGKMLAINILEPWVGKEMAKQYVEQLIISSDMNGLGEIINCG